MRNLKEKRSPYLVYLDCLKFLSKEAKNDGLKNVAVVLEEARDKLKRPLRGKL